MSLVHLLLLAATNSDPYVAVSTVACFLEYQSVGVWLQKWRHAVSYAAVKEICIKGGCGNDRFVKRLGTVVGDDFLNIAINCERPVIFHVREIAIVRFLGSVPG